MKIAFGVSIYPINSPTQEIIHYLKLAKKHGFTKIFTSLFYVKDKDIKKYIDIIRIAKKMGFYVIADVGPESEKVLDSINKTSNVKIDCLRLDTPLPINKINTLSKKFDIQVNASYDTNLFDKLVTAGVSLNKLSAMHNFYPRTYTGLSWTYFHRCNSKWMNVKIRNGAFVTSQVVGTIGQQPSSNKQVKLPTIEKHRNLPITEQAKQLLLTNAINDIFIGNYPASAAELKSMSNLNQNNNIVILKVITNKISTAEKKILNYDNHFCRGDQSDGFIRSVDPRNYFKLLSIVPNINKKKYSMGDVVIINNNDHHYKCELWIINQSNTKLDQDFNYVGYVQSEDLWKLNLIDSWTKFKIVIV